MPERNVPLLFDGGFVGPPIPPVEVGTGLPVMLNLRMGENGRYLTSYPGSMKRLFSKLQSSDHSMGNEKLLFAFKSDDVFGTPGVGLAMVDNLLTNNRRVLGMGHISKVVAETLYDPLTETEWDPATKTNLALHNQDAGGSFRMVPKFYRTSPHEYPSVLNIGKKVHIHDERSLAAVFGDRGAREAGIRRPKRKPGIHPYTDGVMTQTLLHHMQSNATPTADLTAGTGFTMSFVTDMPVFDPTGDGVAYTKMEITGAEIEDDIIKITESWTAATTHVCLAIKVDGKGVLPKGTLAVVLSPSASLTHADATVNDVDENIVCGIWRHVYVPVTKPTGGSVASVGIRLRKVFPTSAYVTPRTAVVRLSTMRRISVSGIFKDRVRVCFCYYDPELKRVSDPSPFSDWLDCGDAGAGLTLDLSGFRGFYDSANNAFAADPVGVNRVFAKDIWPQHPFVTHCYIYINKPEWTAPNGSTIWALATSLDGLELPSEMYSGNPSEPALVNIAGTAASPEAAT